MVDKQLVLVGGEALDAAHAAGYREGLLAGLRWLYERMIPDLGYDDRRDARHAIAHVEATGKLPEEA